MWGDSASLVGHVQGPDCHWHLTKQNNEQAPIQALQRCEQQCASKDEGAMILPEKVQNILKGEMSSE